MRETSEKMAAVVSGVDDGKRKGKKLKKKDIIRKLEIWQKRMGVQDHVVIFDPDWEAGTAADGTKGSAWATIWRADDYHYHVLCLNDGWREAEERMIDNSIVHEMYHVLERDKDNLIDNALAPHLTPAAHEIVVHQYHHHREGVAERVANMLVDAYGPA